LEEIKEKTHESQLKMGNAKTAESETSFNLNKKNIHPDNPEELTKIRALSENIYSIGFKA